MSARTISSVYGIEVADQLAALAIDLVSAAPSRDGQTYAAKVPWSLVRETRAVMSAAGMDPVALARRQEQAMRDARARARAEVAS